jgi:cold shock CspA family protein
MTRHGTITRVEPARGFGFLRDEYGQDWFFVTAALKDSGLEAHAAVMFEEESTALGPRAANIRRVTS